jgi:hypothetical protein
MDKRVDGLAGAMREIAEQRDSQLREAGAISANRLEQLNAFFAMEFPVETTLLAAARRRDASLSAMEPALPAVVRAALIENLGSVRAAATPLAVLRQLVAGLKAMSLEPVYGRAAVVAATILVGFALFHFSRSRNQTARISNQSQPDSAMALGPAPFANVFERPADQLTLQVSRLDLASLDPSLLTIARALPEFEHADRVLPLDLPIRQIRLDVEAVRTP